MAFKFVILAAALACANAGLLQGPSAYSTYAAAGTPAYAYGAAPAISSYHGIGAYGAVPAISAISAYGVAPAVSAYGAYATPAITSQSFNILRSFGNLGQVSTYSKTIDTPFSSVRKSDVRVSNPGVRIASAVPALSYAAAPAIAYGAAPAIHAAPLLRTAVAAPALSYAAAPAIHAAPFVRSAVAAPGYGLGLTYSAAPAVSHINYASAYANYGW